MHRLALREVRRLWSRREALGGLGALGVTGIACRTSDSPAGSPGDTGEAAESSSGPAGTTTGEGSSSTGVDTGTGADSSTGEAGPPQSDCESTAEASFEELFGPIEHVVVLMMENRLIDVN